VSRVKLETSDHRRKLSPEHRAKLSAAARRQYEAETPEQKAARLARIGRKPRAAGDPPAGPTRGPAGGAPPAGPPESRHPLAMTPLELIRHIRGR
jgi:hypothetical protein